MKPIFIIAGERGSGKTTFLLEVLALLQADSYVVGGFVALHDLKVDSYVIKNLITDEESLLMQRTASFDHSPHHFKFIPEGVEAGKSWMKELLVHSPDIATVDEIGRFELAGELWGNGFTQLVESSFPLIFTTKTKQLHLIIEKWEIIPALIFYLDDFNNPQKAFELIRKFL